MSKIEQAQAEYETFTQGFKSVMISTVSQAGIPNASYAPCVIDDAKSIYIYVSGLATHTQNLHVNPHVSVLFIDDESQTQQIFARRRLNFDCTATLIERETQSWHEIVALFKERFGEIIHVLHDLPDFRIFRLTPHTGRFIIGFGTAYKITGDQLDTLVHITPNS
ncbi:HugZ family pyridoxamine 5'-phosphate oxidase [Umezakia ovalisporum]|jgi:putative heme iron utilization protein|uniref:Pyridoxamine 5'-phosphate oxidase family protein n=2 Tax=Umezakia ovalisporum TaxID=75695 RepID=A0AA43GZC0_9CYAN|nr:pyridoxamine 5'-phosphate oxidase family protein [Umezakia ovalisporum]MDH6058310.1 pyridoxamine 5'-phosphate oxidase family protein [Umezakia ovalisporum FSS-43]MDH6064351.1 pyridoxamine 5'-phosphate oxidase family protein [Umezakia ovalisporum FSS-62]MDH6067965.1 pyridoxamine 5'-phosphate oxidase family protein [Umezakia ovalisporum APH033B]MDH6071457.1 pyridoxamine 5'-phosphate oxidase family protein [Umezakia ovalisporum CobakiLakeA]MDH6074673.1 pyridoxamine 5'-phosphate oxidase family 